MEDKEQVQTEINALIAMNQNLNTVPEEVKKAEITSPIASIENGLSAYVKDALDVSRQDMAFNDALQQELLKRLPDMKNAELITLITNNKVNDTDRASKLMAPFTTIIANRQEQEIAAMNAQAAANNAAAKAGTGPVDFGNIRSVNESTDKMVQQGMTQLNNLMTMVLAKATALKTGGGDIIEAETVTKDEPDENKNS